MQSLVNVDNLQLLADIMHFHMAGDVPDSYIRGIAVHHSMARVLTIHGTHFLLIEKSVGFNVKGHNIFI